MKRDHPQRAAATREKIEQGKRIVRGKLARWCFRWALTGAAAAYLLPRHPNWGWTLYLLVPLGIISLFLLLRVYLQLHALGALAALSSVDRGDDG
jgi:hypothetical protein